MRSKTELLKEQAYLERKISRLTGLATICGEIAIALIIMALFSRYTPIF